MSQPLTPISSRNIDLDKMFDPKEWGWRFVAFDLRMPNGQLVEFYMPFQELEEAKKAGNHAIFDKWRDTTKAEKWERREEYEANLRESHRLYDEAWRLAIKRLGLSETAAVASFKNSAADLESALSKLSLRSSAEGIPTLQTPSTPLMTEKPGPETQTAPSSRIETKDIIVTSGEKVAPKTAKIKGNEVME